MSREVSRSLILMKPDALARGLVPIIRERYEREFTIVEEWKVRISLHDLLFFYRKWYGVVSAFFAGFTRTTLEVWIIEGPDAYKRGHEIKHEIRRRYGRPLRNEYVVHCPDHDEEFTRQLRLLRGARVDFVAGRPPEVKGVQ